MTDREALQIAFNALVEIDRQTPYPIAKHAIKCINAAFNTQAQPDPEPLEYWNAVEGWVKIDEVRQHFDSVGCGTIYKNAGEGRKPLYTAPPEQGCGECGVKASDGYALYCVKCVEPMFKKEWASLTDDEIELYDARLSGSGVAREIDAKLKERNT